MTTHLSRTRNQNPDLDLSIHRVIRAPKQALGMPGRHLIDLPSGGFRRP